ncbi:MAG TPA: DUF4402 domain-containing protein [Candidatus Kapabacteria bacterium]|jgi:hypothetical protein
MKKVFIVLCALAFSGIATIGMAQSTATANGTSSATLIKPLTLSVWKAMNFGTFVPGPTGGTVTVVHDNVSGGTNSPAGYTGSVSKAGTQGPQEQPMDFKMTGQANFLVNLSTTNPTTITLTKVGDITKTMVLNPFFPPFVIQAGSTGPVGSGIGARGVGPSILIQLDLNGQAWTSEGGTLNVHANQSPGTYQASWTETVAYN